MSFLGGRSNGLGELWRRAKVLLRRLASQQILFAVHFVYTGIIAFSEAGCNYPAQRLATGVPHFCGLNTLVGYGALAEAMARWQAAQVSALITLTPLFTLLFSDLLSMARPMSSSSRCSTCWVISVRLSWLRARCIPPLVIVSGALAQK